MTKVACPVAVAARTHGAALAWHSIEQSYRYDQFHEQVLQLQRQLLRLSVQRGELIAYQGNNSPTMLALFWACARQGFIFCPLSPKWTQSQVVNLLAEHNIRHVISSVYPSLSTLSLANSADNDCASETAANQPCVSIDIERDAPCNVILTSGSSGFPKAAVHSFANHVASAQGSASMIALSNQDSWLLNLPLFHIGGLATTIRCALAAACVVAPVNSQPLIEQLQSLRPSHVSCVDAQLLPLWQQPQFVDALTRCKALLLGGSAISDTTLTMLEQHNICAFISYGLTEMSSQVATAPVNRQGLVGSPLPGRELTIENGHILMRGPCRFLGYLERGQLTVLPQHQWFDSKDLGQWQQNQLKIVGRADNRFVSGGENIQPETIEALLLRHPQIQRAMVYPLPDERFGQLPHAVIDAQTELTQQQLDAFLADKLPRFMRPRSYLAWPQRLTSVGIKFNRRQVLRALNVEH
ncbi:AMP-binding protein [Paraferrimonas haliotis]|uniref:2-succinylbenzoate-CoA ligase n=1 Tax=Paraferrimonas haliotis TaxID=2013866 RepID=A0AA37WX33_9GAMM|nr:AMP-binding protein [Paraferrimonas haliotis]GLS82085.1 2-succinylbenzoate-CoA ligase [Paraferrimonas haliotis]